MRRRPSNTLIHLVGRTVGFACFILLFRFTQEELAYDTFHPERDRVTLYLNQF